MDGTKSTGVACIHIVRLSDITCVYFWKRHIVISREDWKSELLTKNIQNETVKRGENKTSTPNKENNKNKYHTEAEKKNNKNGVKWAQHPAMTQNIVEKAHNALSDEKRNKENLIDLLWLNLFLPRSTFRIRAGFCVCECVRIKRNGVKTKITVKQNINILIRKQLIHVTRGNIDSMSLRLWFRFPCPTQQWFFLYFPINRMAHNLLLLQYKEFPQCHHHRLHVT